MILSSSKGGWGGLEIIMTKGVINGRSITFYKCLPVMICEARISVYTLKIKSS